jgi:hypothetical protein
MQEKQIATKMFWIHCAEVAHPSSSARGRTASKSSLVVHARTIRVALGAYLLQIELLGETLRLLVEQGTTNNDSKNAKGSSKKKLNLETIMHIVHQYIKLIDI